jgi:hypothetical protein
MRLRSRSFLFLAVLAVVWGFSIDRMSAQKTGGATAKLWNGKVTLRLPASATAPRKVSARLFSIQPRSRKNKFILYVSREPLLKDEVKRSNAQLKNSYKRILESQGYEVIGLTSKRGVFVADFRSYAKVPWQKVGTSPVRGKATFTRSGKELVGSVLLCDPKQWKNRETKAYIKTVTEAQVAP